jgi:hypothetical protein
VRLPAWLVLDLEDTPDGLVVTHTMQAGYGNIGRILDPLLRLYLSKKFEKDMEAHAHYEFPKLAEMLG